MNRRFTPMDADNTTSKKGCCRTSVYLRPSAVASDIGYDGYLTAEILPTKIFPEKGVAAISSFIDGIVGLGQ